MSGVCLLLLLLQARACAATAAPCMQDPIENYVVLRRPKAREKALLEGFCTHAREDRFLLLSCRAHSAMASPSAPKASHSACKVTGPLESGPAAAATDFVDKEQEDEVGEASAAGVSTQRGLGRRWPLEWVRGAPKQVTKAKTHPSG